MRFATRAFAFCFIPFAILLGISFWALQSMVQKSAWEQLRSAMRDKQTSMARMRLRNEIQIGRFLRFASENTALKAGLQLLNSEPGSAEARGTVEDQLQELSSQIGFRLLSIADFRGNPVAWVVRDRDYVQVRGAAPARMSTGQSLSEFRGQLYQMVSVPIDQGDENLGYLTVGDRFDLEEFGVPVVLFQNGVIAKVNRSEAPLPSLAAALAPCAGRPECNLVLNGAAYLSIEIKDSAFGSGYVLRSLQNVDSAAAPVQASLRKVFSVASLAAVFGAFLFSAAASRSMVRPLADVITHLHKSETAGLLVDIPEDSSRIAEIRDLIQSFNRAAASIRDARDGLNAAYVEFIGSLAMALDARDRYTAGHSERVSQLAVSIAQSLGLSAEEQENTRIGALLHDIGKIGIPDHVLQKPGVLSDAEFALIKQHPTIGCRILEGVHGLAPYLPAVEFHHENWDGTGYPRGLKGFEIPLPARIVHVADAWDAMTSDRPYRAGFSHARALAAIQIHAGTHFDPEIAQVFSQMVHLDSHDEFHSILSLAAAVGHAAPGMSAESLQLEQT